MDHKKLQSALDYWQRFAPCLGANITVLYGRGTTQVWHGASGYADTDEAVMMPCQDGYVFSVGKTFTAVLVMRLVESGKIDLDKPIQCYLSNLSFLPQVTIRQLLNHTSGIPSYTDWSDYPDAVRSSPSLPWSEEEFLDRLKSHIDAKGNDFSAGEGWHYSNTGYWLLLRLIEAMSGRSYKDNIHDEISDPLGLGRTRIAVDIRGDSICSGYARELSSDEAMIKINHCYHPNWCYTSLMVSTTQEVSRFYHQLFAGTVVSEESLSGMRQFVDIGRPAGPHFFRPSYGLGLMIDSKEPHGGSFGHGGAGPGFSSWAAHYPDFFGEPLSLTILCNTSMGGHPGYLVKDILSCLARSLSQ